MPSLPPLRMRILCTLLLVAAATVAALAPSSANVTDDAFAGYSSDAFMPLAWYAPVISGGGYCSEALSFASALFPFLGTAGKLALLQHGDGVDTTFLRGLDANTRQLLQHTMRHPPTASSDDPLFRGVAVCHSEPGAWTLPGYPANYQTSLCPPPQSLLTIGRTMFETDRLPHGWNARLNGMDYIWVPTEFQKRVFVASGVNLRKLSVVPEPVDTDHFSPEHARQLERAKGGPGIFAFPGEPSPALYSRSAEELRKRRPFRFLSVFKFEERKNWEGLIEAFVKEFLLPEEREQERKTKEQREGEQRGEERRRSEMNDFSDDEANEEEAAANSHQKPSATNAVASDSEHEAAKQPRVVLYILTSAYHSDSAFQKRIDSFLLTLSWAGITLDGKAPSPHRLPAIRLLPSGLSSAQLVTLYARVDCFVLPSRGEGWGRPHVESMSMSLPIIATFWSGPEAFMSEQNSFPLSIEKELVAVKEGPFAKQGHKWAQPSLTHLRQLMREVYTHPAAARERGRRARKDMQEKFCPACVAKIVVRELARIQGIEPTPDVAPIAATDTEQPQQPAAAPEQPAAPEQQQQQQSGSFAADADDAVAEALATMQHDEL